MRGSVHSGAASAERPSNPPASTPAASTVGADGSGGDEPDDAPALRGVWRNTRLLSWSPRQEQHAVTAIDAQTHPVCNERHTTSV
eukprot:2678741-Rhodomonas_salina.2